MASISAPVNWKAYCCNPIHAKRRMKDSNLQVVSDWLVSNQLQYHYGNTAKCFSIYRHISRSVFTQRRGLQCYTWRIGGVRYELTNPRTQRDWFTVSLLCPLAYPPMPEVRFCWTITSHKTGSVIFHVCTHYYAHVRLQLVTASSPQRYWVEFHRMPKNGIEPFPVSLVVARFWPLFPMSYIDLTAIWRLATMFIVPCVALGFIVFAD